MSARVFISATSADLASIRRVVRDALLAIDHHPVEQSDFPPDYREIRRMLREKIQGCDAVVHLVGNRYGDEPDPDQLPEGTRRRSYTQMEYYLARELGKRVYVFVCSGSGFPYDESSSETDDKQALQADHRRDILRGEQAYVPIEDPVQLDRSVRQLKEDLAQAKRKVRRLSVALIVIAASLVAMALMTYELKNSIGDMTHWGALGERMRTEIQESAQREIEREIASGSTGSKIRDIEVRRNVALERVDDIISAIQFGSISAPNPISKNASEILAVHGTEEALAYLEEHDLTAQAKAELLASKEAQARDEKRAALQPLLLQGVLYETTLQWEKAEENYRSVLAIAPNWSRPHLRMGALQLLLSQYEASEQHLKDALALSDSNKSRIEPLHGLATFYWKRDQAENAVPLIEQAVILSGEVFGVRSSLHAQMNRRLASVYASLGRYDDALVSAEKALVIHQSTLGRESIEAAKDLNNLGVLYGELGKLKEAETSIRESIRLTEHAQEKTPITLAIPLNALAMVLTKAERHAEAKEMMLRAQQIYEDAFGPNHPLAISHAQVSDFLVGRRVRSTAQSSQHNSEEHRQEYISERISLTIDADLDGLHKSIFDLPNVMHYHKPISPISSHELSINTAGILKRKGIDSEAAGQFFAAFSYFKKACQIHLEISGPNAEPTRLLWEDCKRVADRARTNINR